MKELSQVLLCPAGSMTILPTVLFLITGVLRETAVKAVDSSVPVPVSAALQGIKTILTSPLAQVERLQTQWTGLVRSSLASVLEYSQPGEKTLEHKFQLWLHRKEERSCVYECVSSVCCLLDESRPDMDEVSMLTAITLFLLSASTELVGVNVLQKGCLDRFRSALNSSDPWVENLKSKRVEVSRFTLCIYVLCFCHRFRRGATSCCCRCFSTALVPCPRHTSTLSHP